MDFNTGAGAGISGHTREDNEYYLHYAYNKEPNFAGSIFLDFRNHADFQDQNTILYGHNMLNGSMFGSLKHLDVSTSKIIVYTRNRFWSMRQ